MSPLKAVVEAYLQARGFDSYDHPTLGTLWGHPELGEGRRFLDTVAWCIGREEAQ